MVEYRGVGKIIGRNLNIMKKRILLTGASGLLGGNILYHSPADCSFVGIAGRHVMRGKENVEIINLDLLSEKDFGTLSGRNDFDVIIHTAAITNVDRCEDDKYAVRKIHVETTKKLAGWAKDIGARFIHVSTDHIFDGQAGNYFEDSSPRPLNYYAETKLEAEEEIKKIGGEFLIVRTNFFGFNLQDKNDLAGWIVDSLKKGEKVNLFKDVWFSPIIANDLAIYIFEALARGVTGVLHLAGSDACTKYDFGRKLAKAFGLDETLLKPISIDEAGLSVPRPKNMSLNVTLACAIFGKKLPTMDESILKYKNLREGDYQKKLRELFLTSQ